MSDITDKDKEPCSTQVEQDNDDDKMFWTREQLEDMSGVAVPEDAPKDAIKAACAYQYGMVQAWRAAGITDPLQHHVLTKIAHGMASGAIKTGADLSNELQQIADNPKVVKHAQPCLSPLELLANKYQVD